MTEDRAQTETVYGTCVALGPFAALLRGTSGSGKSDLALRFLALGDAPECAPRLVSDDQVIVEATEHTLTVSAPKPLAGLIEVRGIGIQPAPYVTSATLVLVCHLVDARGVPRMPPERWERSTILGVEVPTVKLAPFEASAPLKLRIAILTATAHLRVAKQ